MKFLFNLFLFFATSANAQQNCVDVFSHSITSNDLRGTPETLLALVNDAHPESIQWLLDKYTIDMNVVNHFGMTPLSAAAWNKSPVITSLLLRYPQIQITTRDLHFTYNYGTPYILELLLKDPRVDINGRDIYGNTLLHYAVKAQDVALVERLAKDPRTNALVLNKRGETAMDLSLETQNAEIIEILGVFMF